jgi:FixJ family two-component response regulator
VNYTHPSADQFSDRDRQILANLVAAPDQQTAAAWLGITDRHLRRRIDAIMRRLGAETTYQMIVLATQKGLIDPKALPADT